MMSQLQNSKYTFWELLQKVGIKIPIIQRDYAQGRESRQIVKIRDDFITKLFDILMNDVSIDLDFIYGTVQNGYLIPLDGQQRLTTLFLLHYYVALREKKLDNEKKEILQKFTYETRLSSREFIALMINKDIKLEKNLAISNIIKNQTWFFSEWENDPTVRGMLVMLETIEKYYEERKPQNLFEKLIEEGKITFSFLNLANFKLTDELYVKMNARGKPLTEFENFKSILEKYIDDPNDRAKLDNEWYDIFWKLKNESENPAKEADELFLNFFKNITAFYSEEFNEVDVFKYDYSNIIESIKKILDALYKSDNNLIETINKLRPKKYFNINIFQDFLSIDVLKPEYEKRLRFYALMIFLEKLGEVTESNKKLFKQWMRVCLNIIHNTTYNNRTDFENDKKLLEKLSDEILSNNFYTNLSKSELSTSEQFTEEKLKSFLILKDNSLEDKFIESEGHWYLDGQIGFLIKYAGGESEFCKEYFIRYMDKFNKLFDYEMITSKDNKHYQTLIHRALLTFNGKLGYIKHTQRKNDIKYTFCFYGTALREKNENWRRVFGKNEFKQLLNSIKTIDNIEERLKEIIDKYSFNCNDWKSYCINPKKEWTPIQDAKNYQIKMEDNAIYLNRGDTPATGWGWRRRVELYTWYLFSEKFEIKAEIDRIIWWRIEGGITFKPFSLSYYYQSSDYLNEPCIVLDGYKQYQINIEFEKDKFKIVFFNKDNKDIDNEIKNTLKKCSFKEDSNRLIYDKFTLCNQNSLISFLEKICQQLAQEESS